MKMFLFFCFFFNTDIVIKKKVSLGFFYGKLVHHKFKEVYISGCILNNNFDTLFSFDKNGLYSFLHKRKTLMERVVVDGYYGVDFINHDSDISIKFYYKNLKKCLGCDPVLVYFSSYCNRYVIASGREEDDCSGSNCLGNIVDSNLIKTLNLKNFKY